MRISQQFNKYTNALIKEFSKCDLEMCITVQGYPLRFIPNRYSFKIVREVFKIISIFPVHDGKLISFKDIEPKELMECIKRFKLWAELNGFMFQDDKDEWQRICAMYQ